MYCMYTMVISSLDWLNFVLLSARRIIRQVQAFVLMLSGCGLNDTPLSCRSESGNSVGVGYSGC